MSSYIVSKNPNMYGGGQEEYLTQVEAIVAETAKEFRAAIDQGKDLTQLFYDTLKKFGDIRHEMAVKKNDNRSALMGTFRDDKSVWSVNMITALFAQYKEYNEKLRVVFENYLSSIPYNQLHLNRPLEKPYKVVENTSDGKATSFEFSIITDAFLGSYLRKLDGNEFLRLCDLCEVPKSDVPSGSVSFNFLIRNQVYMKVLKEKHPEEYKRLKFFYSMNDIVQRFCTQEDRASANDWLLVTMRTEIPSQVQGEKSKNFALTQYLTWGNLTHFQRSATFKLRPNSVIILCHQDLFLVRETLADVANCFKKAMEWKGDDLRAFQENDMAPFIHKFSHNMPFASGTSAISEWIEMAIYRTFDYKVEYDNTRLPNLEAFISLSKTFATNYPSMVKATKI